EPQVSVGSGCDTGRIAGLRHGEPGDFTRWAHPAVRAPDVGVPQVSIRASRDRQWLRFAVARDGPVLPGACCVAPADPAGALRFREPDRAVRGGDDRVRRAAWLRDGELLKARGKGIWTGRRDDHRPW